MEISQCPKCQNAFDKNNKLAKQLPCGCLSCLECIKTVYQLNKSLTCLKHKQFFLDKPENLKNFTGSNKYFQEIMETKTDISSNKLIQRLRQHYLEQTQQHQEISKSMIEVKNLFEEVTKLVYQALFKNLISSQEKSLQSIKDLLNKLNYINQTLDQQAQRKLLTPQQSNECLTAITEAQIKFNQLQNEIQEYEQKELAQIDVREFSKILQQQIFGLFIYLNEQGKQQQLNQSQITSLAEKYLYQQKTQQAFSDLFKKTNVYSKQNIVLDKFSVHSKSATSLRLLQQSYEYQGIQNLQYPLSNMDNINYTGLYDFLNKFKQQKVTVQSLLNNPLNISNLNDQIKVLDQLAQVWDKLIHQKLLEIIYISKESDQVIQASSNAATLLNYMNFNFNKMNFEEIKILNADLSDTTFTDCDLSNADLQNCNLRNSKFFNCNLDNANLSNIQTEHPHILYDHTDSI